MKKIIVLYLMIASLLLTIILLSSCEKTEPWVKPDDGPIPCSFEGVVNIANGDFEGSDIFSFCKGTTEAVLVTKLPDGSYNGSSCISLSPTLSDGLIIYSRQVDDGCTGMFEITFMAAFPNDTTSGNLTIYVDRGEPQYTVSQSHPTQKEWSKYSIIYRKQATYENYSCVKIASSSALMLVDDLEVKN